MVYSREDDNGGHDFGILWMCATMRMDLRVVVVDDVVKKVNGE